MHINNFIYLAVLFAAAYGIKALTQRLKLPEVTGYVILGVILGTSVLKFLNTKVLDNLSDISNIALGIISFIIGIELKFDVIKKFGKAIISIALFESVFAAALVTTVLYFVFHASIHLSLLLGAVASATAPAATVAVIRQFKAKGPLTSTILAVVGIDDAFALIIYVFAASFVKASLSGEQIHVTMVVVKAFLSIIEAGAIGAALAFIYVLILRKVKSNEWIMLLLVAFILGAIGVCELLQVSELLAIMVFGAFVANSSASLSMKSEKIMEGFSPIFLAAFFILGGAHLDFRSITVVGITGILYFGLRTAGKIGGAALGAVVGGAPKTVKKFIGFALLPQVGVALALALAINKDFNLPVFGEKGKFIASSVINILLFTTIITEIVGPLLTKRVLLKSGEAGQRKD
ncbi:MAG: sodium:proton exchanger [Spirochaetales bacterium]|nr:MAG: sodium:proton exchanger [Spirochaetales bacterium]